MGGRTRRRRGRFSCPSADCTRIRHERIGHNFLKTENILKCRLNENKGHRTLSQRETGGKRIAGVLALRDCSWLPSPLLHPSACAPQQAIPCALTLSLLSRWRVARRSFRLWLPLPHFTPPGQKKAEGNENGWRMLFFRFSFDNGIQKSRKNVLTPNLLAYLATKTRKSGIT